MKLGILGTRGIPNHYGGFEQFAEYLATGMVLRGHEVWVYNSHLHPYKEKVYKGANIIHRFDAEHRMGTAGQFIYDLNCILDARKRKFDILLQLGYTSSSIWAKLLPHKPTLTVTNMDGLEWKRSKYSRKVQTFLEYAESWAVNSSDHLVADSIGIQDYLKLKYEADSTYIAYGAELPQHFDRAVCDTYNVEPERYDMLIARMEPENNIEIILNGVAESKDDTPFLVVGGLTTTFGQQMREQFSDEPRIRFLGAIYDTPRLDQLRHFSRIYFHGHSVGGTNPSLLEAMASGAFICAHKNDFNRYILGDNAVYFMTYEDVAVHRETFKADSSTLGQMKAANRDKIARDFTHEKIISQYESLFLSLLNKT